MEKQRTHIEVTEPEISVRYLADFMGASERKRRSIVEGCKYRPVARLVQHKEATVTIANAIRTGALSPAELQGKADFIRSKLATDDFESLTNEINADYIQSFSSVISNITLPDVDILPGITFSKSKINDVKIKFSPHLILRRIDKTNKQRRGALMLRYAKGKHLSPIVGAFQSAAAFGILRGYAIDDGTTADKSICLTSRCVRGGTVPGAQFRN